MEFVKQFIDGFIYVYNNGMSVGFNPWITIAVLAGYVWSMKLFFASPKFDHYAAKRWAFRVGLAISLIGSIGWDFDQGDIATWINIATWLAKALTMSWVQSIFAAGFYSWLEKKPQFQTLFSMLGLPAQAQEPPR